jgi:menaquinol-cytochrome c reductase iron-sulfur subunit
VGIEFISGTAKVPKWSGKATSQAGYFENLTGGRKLSLELIAEIPVNRQHMTHPKPDPASPERRNFLTEGLSVIIGGLVGLVPAAAGLAVYLDPLRRKSQVGNFVRVTSLDALPNDGVPRKFPVLASKTDAWTKTAQTPIGAVYLRRTGETALQAFNVVCPHAGCFVDYMPERIGYFCPCHNSTFAQDGKLSDANSPSPRGLDTLECEIRNQKEVWVKFQNFQAGHAEKIPAA